MSESLAECMRISIEHKETDWLGVEFDPAWMTYRKDMTTEELERHNTYIAERDWADLPSL